MAVAGLLALLDDIATMMDDVAIMTKLAAKKTSGIITDDLVVTAEKVGGVASRREVPVVLSVAKGSLINKAILVPAALLISSFAPFLIVPLLLIGGGYLCFEAAEKIWHSLTHHKHSDEEAVESVKEAAEAVQSTSAKDLAALEKDKIKGAVRTDFILSAEIIVISLSVVAEESLLGQILTLVAIALLMTVLVYGTVIAIMKMDDFALYLIKKNYQKLGQALLTFATKMMGWLSFIGTAAMLLVGGGIYTHNIPFLHHLYEGFAHMLGENAVVQFFAQISFDALAALIVGVVLVIVIEKFLTHKKVK